MFTMGPPMWGGETGDPYWSYVKTLLHFDGSLADSAAVPLTWSASGSAATTGTGQLYGTGCLDCRTTTSDGITVGGGELALGTSDFCIEAWFYEPNNGSKNQWWFDHIGSVDSIGLWSLTSSTFVPNGGGGTGLSNQAYSFSTWTHIAIVRNGNTMYCYLNGVQTHSWSCTGWNHGTGIAQFYLGRSSGGGSGRMLMVDEFRVTVGVPRYTGAFTPSGPFPNRAL